MKKIRLDINKISDFVSEVMESYFGEYLLNEAVSRENIIDAIYEDGRYDDIDEDIIEYCISKDSSSKLKLTKWLLDVFVRELNNGKNYDELCKELESTVSFMESSNNFQPFSYKTYQDAMNAMFELNGKNDYSVGYQDNYWTVILPQNAFALKYVILNKLKKTDNKLCVIWGANGKPFNEWYDKYSDNGEYIYYVLYNKQNGKAYLLNSNPKYKQEFRNMYNGMIAFSSLKNTDNMSAWFLETQNIDLFDTGTESTKRYILNGNYYLQHHTKHINTSLYSRDGKCITENFDLGESDNDIQVEDYGDLSIAKFSSGMLALFFYYKGEVGWETTWDLNIGEEGNKTIFSGVGQIGYREVCSRHNFKISVDNENPRDITIEKFR